MKLEDLLAAILAAQTPAAPPPDQTPTKAQNAVQQLLAALPTLLPLVLPLLVPLLQKLVQRSAEPAVTSPKGPTPVDPHEPIPPPPGVVEPPAFTGLRAILEVQGFIFAQGGIVAFPNVTRDLDGKETGDGSYWGDRITKRKPLNNGTKILVTPTVYDPAGRELDSGDWDERDWIHNIKYFAEVQPDPSNPNSVQQGGVSGFVGDGTPTTLITIDPKGAPANVGGDRYRNGKGRAATIKIFAEGLWKLWAELPGGVVTEAVEFQVR
jgi:hypothetical protein